jgi:hypothetical protein
VPDVQHPDPSEAIVYALLPSELTLEDIENLAVVLGIDAAPEELEDGTFLAQDTFLLPAGPVTLTVESGSFTLGLLSSDLSPACLNGIDDDGDGATDDFDPDCFTIADDDEATPGRQERDPTELGSLTGQLDEEGLLTIESLALPALSGTLPGDGILAGELSLVSGSGAVDPIEATADLDLELDAAISCTGSDCSLSACSVSLSASLAWDDVRGRGYATNSGTATLAGSVDVVDGDCGPDFLQALGLQDGTPFAQLALRLDPVFGSGMRRLVFDPLSGRGHLVTTDVERLIPAEPTLPTEDEAIDLALMVADLLQLELPGRHGVVFEQTEDRDGDGEPEAISVGVRLEAHLEAATWEGQLLTGHVEGGNLDLVLGHEGQILSMEVNWRNVIEFATVPILRRAELVAQAEGLLLESYPEMPVEELSYSLGYPTGRDHHGHGPLRNYLAPEWLVETSPGLHFLTFPASSFRPTLELVEAPGNMADGSLAIPFAVEVTGGTAPYLIEWFSDLDGEIGTGESIEAVLSNGTHVVRAAIVAANSALNEVSVVFTVTGSLLEDEERDWHEFDGSWLTDPTIIAYMGRPAAGGQRQIAPLVSVRIPNGKLAATMWWEEWRYTLSVDIRGTTYSLRSGRCVPGVNRVEADGSWTACGAPVGTTGEDQDLEYFAEIDQASYNPHVTNPGTPSSGWQGEMIVRNLPGTIALRSNFVEGQYFAGPGFTRRGLKPQVRWKYFPPEGGIPCQDLVDFCQQNPGADPASAGDDEPWCNIPRELYDPEAAGYVTSEDICCVGDETYEVLDADILLTAATDAVGGRYGAYTAFAEDYPLSVPFDLLDTSAGIGECLKFPDVIDLPAPLPALNLLPPGDMMCGLNPNPAELSVSPLVAGDLSNRWDSVHLKGQGPWNTVFPFGNHSSLRILRHNVDWLRLAAFRILPWDLQPVVHHHQDWHRGGVSYGVGTGNTVEWHLTLGHSDEVQTTNSAAARDFADNETIFLGESTGARITPPFSNNGPGAPFGDRRALPIRFWRTSQGLASQAAGGGGYSNHFEAPFFFTPAGLHP